MKIATKKNMAKVKGDPYLLKSQTPGKYLNTSRTFDYSGDTYAPNTSKSSAFVTNYKRGLILCIFFQAYACWGWVECLQGRFASSLYESFIQSSFEFCFTRNERLMWGVRDEK